VSSGLEALSPDQYRGVPVCRICVCSLQGLQKQTERLSDLSQAPWILRRSICAVIRPPEVFDRSTARQGSCRIPIPVEMRFFVEPVSYSVFDVVLERVGSLVTEKSRPGGVQATVWWAARKIRIRAVCFGGTRLDFYGVWVAVRRAAGHCGITSTEWRATVTDVSFSRLLQCGLPERPA